MSITDWLWVIGIVSLILFILAIVWKPSRVAIGVILCLLGVICVIGGITIFVGIPMLFFGVIFMVTGLRTKREPVDVRINYERRPKASRDVQPQKRGPMEVQILPEEQTETIDMKIQDLTSKEQDLRNDLMSLKDKRRMKGISPELIQTREKELQKELIDVVLEKERLARKLKGQE